MSYSPSGGAVSKQLPFGMSNLPLDAKLKFNDTINFTKRAFVSTAEILDYYPLSSPFRNGSFEILLNTGGTLLNGVITGGVESIWWFSGGVADVNLIQKYYTTLQVDNLIGNIPSPNLQNVTNGAGNNVTTNVLQVTNALNFNPAIQSTALYNYGSALNGGGVGITNGTTLRRLVEYNDDNHKTVLYNDGTGNGITIQEETPTEAGILLGGRVRLDPAINGNEGVTLDQLNAAIPATPSLQQVTIVGATTDRGIQIIPNSSQVGLEVLSSATNKISTIKVVSFNAGVSAQLNAGETGDLRARLVLQTVSGGTAEISTGNTTNLLITRSGSTQNTLFSDGRISGTTATNANEFVTKSYTDTGLATKANLNGGNIFNGNQTVNGDVLSTNLSTGLVSANRVDIFDILGFTAAGHGFLGTLDTATLTATRNWDLPNVSGTLLVASDLTPYQLLSEKGNANGYAPLDGSNKIPLAFLPAGFQTYKGTYDASTNTPTLVNGTGTAGDTYRVTVAGSQDFGAGSIAFIVGDDVIYNGTIWQRNPSIGGITLGTANGLSLIGQQLSLALSSTSTVGALSSIDWNTFNGKQNALGFTPENVANKSTSLASPDNTKYPTTLAVSTELALYELKSNFEKIPFTAATGIINIDFTINSRQSKFPNPDIRAYNVTGSIEDKIIGFNEKITRSGANISTVELNYIAGDGYILLTNN